jgi:exonuclease III
MKYCNIILFFTLSSWVFMQECPPSDTLSIDPIQNMWNIPMENNWDEIEVMTWNIKQFPISNNTINYVNEIISDILPDVIAFQEINNSTAFNTLSSSLPAYDFINSGNGLALAVRADVLTINSYITLFSGAGYEFAWRYPLKVELSWVCGLNSAAIHIINVHLKSGGSSEDFDRRFASCEYLSDYVNDHPNDNIIILGDYNDEITDSQNNNSLWPLVADDTIEFATEPIANNNYYASYPSWPSFIDHIAVSTPLFDELNIGNIQTIRVDDYTGYSFYHDNISDHRPVIWSFSVEPVELAYGLVINEIIQNPDAVSDAAGEWIEITNISDETINLHNLILRDDGGEQHIISENVEVTPGSYIVLGAEDDFTLNGGVTVDYEYSGFTLSNLWDEVILEHPSGVILDEVHYDNGETFPDEEGKSMMLTNFNFDNSIGENWIFSTSIFGSGDFGTPGEPNTSDECQPLGDMNNDGSYNVLDVVILVNCVLADTCVETDCSGDLNGDGAYNVLDIVNLVNCILGGNCGE